MAPVYPTSIKFYAYISSAWTELNDAGGAVPVTVSWGLYGNSPVDRVAETGEMRLALDNSGGLYTPGGPSALAGFKKGIPVKMVITFEGEEYNYRFYIDDIDPKPSTKDKLCYVQLVDWMDYAERHPIVNPGIQTSKRGDEVLTTILSEIEVSPQAQDFDTDGETFDNVFDTVTSKTTAYSEASKVAFSELGYVYLKKNKVNGETLVFESADSRHGWRTNDEIPLAAADSDFLLLEDGSFLLLESGDKLILNQAAAATFDGSVIENYSAPYGDHVINRMTVNAYPRRLSASPEILFSLDEEIVIGSGQTYTLKGTYVDPDGGLPINGQDMITPAATTDYTMYTATAGGGSAITGSLTVSITYGTEGFTALLTNGNAARGYVNKFQTRGTGIYRYNPIEHTATNAASVTEFEAESATIHQKYKGNLYAGSVFVDSQVDEHNQPRVALNSITFTANTSAAMMMAFLHTDVGDVRYIDIDELGLAGNYYVQGVEFTMNGKIITVTWIVALILSLQTSCGLSPLAVEFNGTGGVAGGTGVMYDYLPRISAPTVTGRSFSFWMYQFTDSPAGADFYTLIGPFSDTGGMLVYTKATNQIKIYNSAFSGANGIWNTPDNTFSINAWTHVLIVYAHQSIAADPIIYVNGVSQTVTETETPSGTWDGELGVRFGIGNHKTTGSDYLRSFDGKLFDVRVYDRLLSEAEVTTIYNSGTPDSSVGSKDGLVFQAFAVRTVDLATYTDASLTSEMTLRDNAYGAVGTPVNSPIGRAAP